MTRDGRSTVKSGKSALGAAFIARGLAGNPSRDPKTGRKKSPGLVGAIFLVLFGGVFLGVGLYVHSHSAAIQSRPGTKGSAALMGWICIAVGGLVVLLAGLTLLNRIVSLIVGVGLLIAGRFERPKYTGSQPGPGPVSSPAPAQFAPFAGGAESAPLLPPPLDPRLPGAGG